LASTAPELDTIYEALKHRILSGAYKPDHKLSEVPLSREFTCSRTPIREALKRLETEGLLYIKPKSGTYVRKMSAQQLIELQEVRTYLEKLAFRLAIKAVKPEQLTALREAVATMDKRLNEQPFRAREFSRRHYAFHHTLVQSSANPLLLQLYDALNLQYSHLFFEPGNVDLDRVRISNKEHAELLDRLEAGELREGEELIDIHLWVKKRILDSVYLA
ncbi:MAG: GntR family transcriptional regulator, partial [Spirochaetes bacterium]|nr:GntR family transcriptional regulator [Spirochaetota bacterium]